MTCSNYTEYLCIENFPCKSKLVLGSDNGTIVILGKMQVFAELKDLAAEIASVELVSPTLIIIGKVVALSPFWPHPIKEASSCLTEVL